MSLKNLEIKESWLGRKDNIVEDFFVPTLKEAKEYRRITGFFHSKCLVALSSGMVNFLKRGGKIKLVSWVYLTKKDYEAVQKGLKNKGQIMAEWEKQPEDIQEARGELAEETTVEVEAINESE